MEREFIHILEKIQKGNLDARTYRKIQSMPDSKRMLFHQFIKEEAPGSLKELPDFDAIWLTIQNDLSSTPKPDYRLMYRLLPYAAAILIGMVSFYLGRDLQPGIPENTNRTSIIAPMGTLSEVRLPDNSRIWLNAGSEIQYDQHYNQSNRDLILNGEAFFQIAENNELPLKVSTNSMEVVARGTTFFINAYESNEKVTVGLIEGMVSVKHRMQELEPVELEVMQKVQFNAGRMSLDEVSRDDYSWKEGVLVIDDLPLFEITQRLENFYNQNIILEGKKAGELRFSLTVKEEPLEEILQLLSLAAPVTYRQDEELNYIISTE